MKLDDAYTILGIEPGCNGDDIRRAFRRQALIWHPDKNCNREDCTEMFQRIQAAYAKLTREYSCDYSDESDDDCYDDDYDDDDDDTDCDYDCDCFFHGGIPPWEFFEQLFAAMESGQYNGYPDGFPFHEGGFFHRGSHGENGYHHHCEHHKDCAHHTHDPDSSYDYAYESRDERRHREREEQKLEKMWRKEMEMAERENIRAANAAKAARSIAQERNIRAWMRQMPRPTMSSRSDRSIELVLVRRGVATDELPDTCLSKLETRKNGEPIWNAMILPKDMTKVNVDNLDPGTSYYFRVCGGQRQEKAEKWGEWSVESRYATTGKAPNAAVQVETVPLEKSKRPVRNSIFSKAHKAPSSQSSAQNASSENYYAAPSKQLEDLERLKQEEKERAIQKALEAAASEYEDLQKSFLHSDANGHPSAASKKKKKKKKGKGGSEGKEDIKDGFENPGESVEVLKSSDRSPAMPLNESKSENLADTEADELARALKESLATYNSAVAARQEREAAINTKIIEHWNHVPSEPAIGSAAQWDSLTVPNELHVPVDIPAPPPALPRADGEAQLYQSMQQQPLTTQHIRSPTVCKFFNSEQGCKWGMNCKFQHIARPGTRVNPMVSIAGFHTERLHDMQQGDFLRYGAPLVVVGPDGIPHRPLCSSYMSGAGCPYGAHCPFSHDLPMPASMPPQIPGQPNLPPTLFPEQDSYGPALPGVIHDQSGSLVHPAQVADRAGMFPPVSQPQGRLVLGQQPPMSDPTAMVAIPGSVANGMRASEKLLLPPPPLYLQGYNLPPQESHHQHQLPLNFSLPTSAPIPTFYPAAEHLTDGPQLGPARHIFPQHPGFDSGGQPPASFLSGPPLNGIQAANNLGWGVQQAAEDGTKANGFASFPDFSLPSLGGILGDDLGDASTETDHELNSAALDAEAFLNSIQDVPATGTLSRSDENLAGNDVPKMPLPISLPAQPSTQSQEHESAAATAAPQRSLPAYSRPRYNPVAAYNPLAAQGKKA